MRHLPFDPCKGKRAMKITSRRGSWAGPQQLLKYGANIRKNAVYTASMWIKSLGSGNRMDTFELTVKIDYRLGCKKFVHHPNFLTEIL